MVTCISRDTTITDPVSFESLGLDSELLTAVKKKGYTIPTPIQAGAIPGVLAGRDVLAGAQTGTGKTAAFALPILQNLKHHAKGERRPRALVLTPTRELAAQILESFQTYGSQSNLRSTVIFGGVGFQPQVDCLKKGIDILVATPGRLLDHAGQGTLKLSKIEILVLDEADRMLDMGFLRDIRRVLALLPAKRQNLLFSATYSSDIRKLATGLLHEPDTVEVARRNTAAELVDQAVYFVGKKSKKKLLSALIREGKWQQVLVFTRTKHGANRLAKQLEKDGITAVPIHGNKSQTARTKALAGFKAGAVRVLVATDIAARGLDIDRLPHVVNFELPNVSEDYVHRIGRTGRAGREGSAISLVCEEEGPLLSGIQKLLGREVLVLEHPDFAAEEVSVQNLKALPKKGPPKRVDKKRRSPRKPKNRQGQQNSKSESRQASPSGKTAQASAEKPTKRWGRRPSSGRH